MANIFKRVWRSFDTHIDVFAVVYIAGLFVMVGGSRDADSWVVARAVAWVFGGFAMWLLGARDGKRAVTTDRED